MRLNGEGRGVAAGRYMIFVLLVDLNSSDEWIDLLHYAGRRLAELEIHVLLIQVRVH